MQIGNLAGCQVEGWSLTCCRPCEIFHMTPELNGDTFFSKASILVSYIKFRGCNFRGKTWCGFRLAYLLFGRFFGSRLIDSCLGTGGSFWIQYLRVGHASLKTTSPIFALEANRGKPVGSAWDFVLQSRIQMCLPTYMYSYPALHITYCLLKKSLPM